MADYGDPVLNNALNASDLTDEEKEAIAANYGSGFQRFVNPLVAGVRAPGNTKTEVGSPYASGGNDYSGPFSPEEMSLKDLLRGQMGAGTSDKAANDAAMSMLASRAGSSPSSAAVPNASSDIPSAADLFGSVSDKLKQKSASGDVGSDMDASPEPEDIDESKFSAAKAGAAGGMADQMIREHARKDYLSNLLSSIYGSPGLGANGMADAIAQRNQQQAAAQIVRGAQNLNAGIARGRGPGFKADETYPDELLRQAQQPVQDIQMQQQLAEQKLMTALHASDFTDKAQLQDPESDLSAAYRAVASKLNPSLANVPAFQNMSAEGVKNLTPMVDAAAKAQFYAAQRQQMMNMKQEQMGGQALQQTLTQLNNPRPTTAVGQAKRDLYAAQKADSLVKMFPDANDMPVGMAKLYANELVKIASGGAPTLEALKGIDPGTLQEHFSDIMSKIQNNPNPANVGAFIKQYAGYTQTLAKDAKNTVYDYNNALLESEKDRLSDSRYNTLKKQYLDPYASQEIAKTGSSVFSPVKVSNGTQHFIINNPDDLKAAQADGFKVVQ
jgi:hypothetical protein